MSSITKSKIEKPASSWIILVLAIACGVIVANLYYAQPLVGPISSTLGLSSGAAGLIVTLTQIGYGIGLLFIVPLGDILENRKLVVTLLLFTAVVLAIAAVVKALCYFLQLHCLSG